ncbi:membrane-associated progesterone receptor component 1-like [Tubulanus polymorphus]|uniref:membrane-associated progesterone receptor component 1-like n=1 Tax=Tubulanus polymorphus TaxID=672921 RepID=UPI003DA3FD40
MADEAKPIEKDTSENGAVADVLAELLTSPINVILLVICLVLIYKIFSSRNRSKPVVKPEIPKLKKRDFYLNELRQFDGTGEHGRILMAVNGKVFDVTRGKRFYGPGGPYGVFAGRDASRGLATFSLTPDVLKDDIDDLSDLNSMQMESVREWEMQFTEKYDYVGKLLKAGESPTEYSDIDDETSTDANKSKND